jgi:hypothetical protein
VVAKNRNGVIGTAKLGFNASITKFTNYYHMMINENAQKVHNNKNFYEEFDPLGL